MVKVTTSR